MLEFKEIIGKEVEVLMRKNNGVQQKSTELVKRSPYLYRLAVITVFRDAYDKFKKEDHPFGSLKGIIQDMASYCDMPPEDLKLEYSKKLGNILSEKTEGTRFEDVEHFILIEQFVWRHAADEIAGLNIRHHLSFLENLLEEFWGNKTHKSFGQPREGVLTLKDIDSSNIYEFDFINITGNLDERKEESYYSSNNDFRKYCLAIKSLEDFNFDLAIIFREAEIPMLYFGVYFRQKNYFLMRSFRDKQPLCINLDYNNVTEMKVIRSTSSIIPEKISNELSGSEIVSGVNPHQVRLNKITDEKRRKYLLEIAQSYIKELDINN